MVKRRGVMSKKPKGERTEPTKSTSIADQEQQVLEVGGTLEAPVEEELVVRNNQFVATFVKPRFEKRKETLIVGFDLSFNLVDQLTKFIPRKVIPRWHEVRDGGIKRLDMTDILSQQIEIALFPEDGKPEGSRIVLDIAVIERARIEEIVSTGDGKESRNIRLSFTAYVDQTKEAVNFAAWKHDSNVWLTMKSQQGEFAFAAEG